MIKVLATGARGFLGRNLVAQLHQRDDCQVFEFDREQSIVDLEGWLSAADIVFHLAGVNRPNDPAEYEAGNAGFTEQICAILQHAARSPKIVFASSIQAELENPYGISKRKAEDVLRAFSASSGAIVHIYRLNNLFGKWCRPNYNSVIATFCYNIANDLPISISDPQRELELSYVDDVIGALLEELDMNSPAPQEDAKIPSFRIRLGDLAGRIQAFREFRASLTVPNFTERFNRALYATYLSYVPPDELRENLTVRADGRGSLAEFIKSECFGQIFVSRTRPGVTRGNHYHHTKTEKFFVVEGDGLIRMRAVDGTSVQTYRVKGNEFQVVNIPPGVTHSITNVGTTEMVVLFWSSEVFDPDHPDTYFLPVDSNNAADEECQTEQTAR